MSDFEEELETRTANAMDSEENGADENTDFQEEEDRGGGFTDEGGNNQDNEDSGDGNQAQDDDLDDDDDSDSDEYLPPIVGAIEDQDTPQSLDIRTLREADGSIDATKANKAIEDYANKLAEAKIKQFTTQNDSVARTTQQLTTQWQSGQKKYPGVAKNKDLANIARDIHLTSIEKAKAGTGRYYSPVAAMKKVDAMSKRIAKSGYQSAKSRRSVVKTGQTEKGNGKGSSNGQPTDDYSKARKMSLSSDPAVAKQGRMKVLEIRRLARENDK